ncbi:MAG: hypothetical protein FJY92_04840 [Candidatus Hydrogenedentes bacterium]|nr:hypothetical protein [Candidatus Hydrogenedentota bacterium]
MFSAIVVVLALGALAAFAAELDREGIKSKVEDAVKARDAGARAAAEGKADEAKQLAETSARLFDEARAGYASLRAGESDDVSLLIDYADSLSATGDYDLAEKPLLRAVAIDRENAAAWLKLGQTEGQLGPSSESRAIRSLRRAAEIEPKTAVTVQANASLGAMYQQSGLYDFAREAYAKALEQQPDHVGATLAIAALDAREGQMVKAKAAYDAVGEKAMQYASFVERTLGMALADFDQSRRLLEDTAEMHLAYAELLARAGRLSDSYWPLNRALKLDGTNYVAWNLMGSVLRTMGNLSAARNAFEKSLALNADQPRTRDAIADVDQALAASGAQPPDSSPQSTAVPETSPPADPSLSP